MLGSDMPARRLTWALLGCLSGTPGLATADCLAHSGAARAVLMELYTSEGCNSCPPADRRLSQWKGQPELAGVLVPLAFHVDYWDDLGWVDRFANPRHAQRQRDMAARAGSRLIYTPQFLRNGRDWRSQANPLEHAGADGAGGAQIVLGLNQGDAGTLAVSGEIHILSRTLEAEAYIALYENNLESQVPRGENAGNSLRHDFVVRRLIGPLEPDKSGRVSLRQPLTVDAGWKPSDLGVVAFVQEKASGAIVQALQRHVCDK
jgi:hypothetical protein